MLFRSLTQSLGTPTGIAIRDSSVYVADAIAGRVWLLGGTPLTVTADDIVFLNGVLYASYGSVVHQVNAFGGSI